MDSGTAELCSVRTCPVRIEDSFQPLVEVPRVRAIFSELESREHTVTSSKPVLVIVLFRRLPNLWGRPRETSEG